MDRWQKLRAQLELSPAHLARARNFSAGISIAGGVLTGLGLLGATSGLWLQPFIGVESIAAGVFFMLFGTMLILVSSFWSAKSLRRRWETIYRWALQELRETGMVRLILDEAWWRNSLEELQSSTAVRLPTTTVPAETKDALFNAVAGWNDLRRVAAGSTVSFQSNLNSIMLRANYYRSVLLDTGPYGHLVPRARLVALIDFLTGHETDTVPEGS